MLICIFFKFIFFTFLCQISSKMLLTTLRLDLPITRPYLGQFQRNLACWNAIKAFYAVGPSWTENRPIQVKGLKYVVGTEQVIHFIDYIIKTCCGYRTGYTFIDYIIKTCCGYRIGYTFYRLHN